MNMNEMRVSYGVLADPIVMDKKELRLRACSFQAYSSQIFGKGQAMLMLLYNLSSSFR